jgi:protein TonB
MGHAQVANTPPIATHRQSATNWKPSDFRFESLILSEPSSRAKGLSATLATSMALHAILITTVVILPLLFYEALPEPGASVRAFFATPADVAPPPPPPPPPAAGPRVVRVAPPPQAPVEPATFVAPIEVPDQIRPEEASLDLGVEGGVAGGVEGGIAGGVLGGVVGGLPAAPPPPPKVIRIGGALVAPKLVRRVQPVYPEMATLAHVQGIVILEAQVDVNGQVKDVKVLRGLPLLDDAAMEAVRQWRYQPLLLNGVPTEFILTVTMNFNLKAEQPN